MSDWFTDANGNSPQKIFAQFYATYDAYDVPDWLRILAYVLVIHGLIELFMYTALTMALPIKWLFGNCTKRQKLMSFSFIVIVLYVRSMYVALSFNLLPPTVYARNNGTAYTIPPFFADQVIWIVISTYFIFGSLPLLTGIYAFFQQRVWRNRAKTPSNITNYAKVSVIMPIYNEILSDLLATVHSVLKSNYLGQVDCYCAFDDDEISDTYLGLLNAFNIDTSHPEDLPMVLEIKVEHRLLVIARCVHGGKRITQGNGWKLVQERNGTTGAHNHHVVLIDSDVVLDIHAIHNIAMMFHTDKSKKILTGFITCKETSINPLVLYQQPEYMQGQCIFRVMESCLGGITCAPGAFTIIQYDELLIAGAFYFDKLPNQRILDYHRFHLGEDRYLTYLVIKNNKRGAAGMCITARANTAPVRRFGSFIEQRRRWLLGTLTNETAMIMSFKLWKQVPLLLIWRTLEFCNRFIFSYVIVFVLFYACDVTDNINALIFYLLPFVTQWFMIIVYALRFGTYSDIITFFWLLIATPALNTFVYIHALRSFLKRSWGGPRALGKANDEIEFDDLDKMLLLDGTETYHEDMNTDYTVKRDFSDY